MVYLVINGLPLLVLVGEVGNMSWLEEFGREHNATTSAGVAGAVSGGTPTFNTIEEYQAYEAANAPKKAKKSKNFWLDQLSTAGGIGGSLGGTALGTAILPGIGTLIGGILGGALGSAGGQAGENIVTGDSLDQGVASEALFGGLTGVPILGAAKGIAGAGKALASGAGKTAANTALKNALKVGAGKAVKGTAATIGKGAVADVLGIKTGAKLAGKGILKPQYIDDLTSFVYKQAKGGVPDAAKILTRTQGYADDIGKAIAKKISSSKVAVNGSTVSGDIIKNLQKELIDTDNPLVKGVLDKLKTTKSPSDLWKLRKILDGKISWIANPDAATSASNALSHNMRNTISKYIDKAGVSGLNKEYSLAQDAIKLMQKSALNPKGINILGNRIGGGIAQRGQILGGKLFSGAQGLGESAIGKIPTGLIGATARQFGGRALGGQDMGTQPMPDTQMPTSTPDMMGGQGIQEPTQSSNPYPREALLYDIQRDPRNATKYIAYYQNLQEVFPAQESAKYSSVIAGNISDFQSSLNELNNLSGAITSGSGSVDPIMGRIRSMNPYDVDQQTLQAMIDKTRQIVGKALEGGVLRKEDEEKYKKILPTTSDTKATALNKIAMIQAQLNQKMQSYQSMVSGGATSSLEDALMQSQNQTNYNNTGSY